MAAGGGEIFGGVVFVGLMSREWAGMSAEKGARVSLWLCRWQFTWQLESGQWTAQVEVGSLVLSANIGGPGLPLNFQESTQLPISASSYYYTSLLKGVFTAQLSGR